MGKEEEITKAMSKPVGKLPVDDEKTFSTIVGALQNQWDITEPAELMLVNRMVSTFMKMKKVEAMLGEQDLYFEYFDDKGRIRDVRINNLATYLRNLESDFRAYYRSLTLGKRDLSLPPDAPKDIMELLREDADKSKKTKK